MSPKLSDPIDCRVGQRIRAIRVARGLSQDALGEKIGVSFQQVQKYEKGANRVGSSRLKRIAEALQVPVAELFGTAEQTEEDSINGLPTDLIAVPGAIRLLRAYCALPQPELRRALVALAEEMGRACGAHWDAEPEGAVRSSAPMITPAV